ncbi:hypothetical protein C8R46DRAFT_1002234 [Mycena filopes]|nr:hypothetical protein C8R46DRAFT_1002234 [Mycena filopes]
MRPNNIPGQEEGPSAPDSWKRAVYRPAPSQFTVEVLPPVKLIGGTYNFKLRISPVARGDRSSVSSRGSNVEYDVLRRWEDCLIYQDGLEREYARLALSKRQRLLAGKGVRKNGIYLQDRASSWESLPPGPEPDSVAQNIHDLVPRLTKKGTMFRASQATIDQRQAELTAFIAALLQPDVPTLLEDFRKERIVTDFFGFWRRDQDIQKNANKAKARPTSVTSSFFSPGSLDDYEYTGTRGRADSSASSDSSSALSSAGSAGSARSSMSIQIMLDDKPVPFGHNPNLGGVDTLEPLRTSSEIGRKNSRGRGGFLSAVTKRVRKTSNAESSGGRTRQSLDEEPPHPDSRASTGIHERFTHRLVVVHRPNRESWQTTASGMTFLGDLNLSLPTEDDEDSRRSRMSMASIATFRTEVSSEGIIPRYYVPEPNLARLSTATFMTDVSADAIIPRSRRTDSVMSDEESVLDEYFYGDYLVLIASPQNLIEFIDAFPSPPQHSRPETPVGQIPSALDSRKEALAMARAPSPNPSVLSASPSVLSEQSTFSDSTGTTITPSLYSFYSARSTLSTTTASTSTTAAGPPLTIKAAHNDSIILLRATGDLPLRELRWRLREKFAGQEGVALSEHFSLAYMIPAAPSKGSAQAGVGGGGRGRANSLSATGTLADTALMEKISTEADWARLRSSLEGAKLTLRVMDCAASS